MNSHSAVRVAKEYMEEMFEAESIGEIGLEEIEFDETEQVWVVTIGFSRDWRHAKCCSRSLSVSQRTDRTYRTYKVLKIDDTSEGVRSMKHREIACAA